MLLQTLLLNLLYWLPHAALLRPNAMTEADYLSSSPSFPDICAHFGDIVVKKYKGEVFETCGPVDTRSAHAKVKLKLCFDNGTSHSRRPHVTKIFNAYNRMYENLADENSWSYMIEAAISELMLSIKKSGFIVEDLPVHIVEVAE